MSLPDFLCELDKRVLVCDGAMGTMLYTRGVVHQQDLRCDLNLTQPDLVADVHQCLRSHAGADVLETNTFGANRIKLGDRSGWPIAFMR